LSRDNPPPIGLCRFYVKKEDFLVISHLVVSRRWVQRTHPLLSESPLIVCPPWDRAREGKQKNCSNWQERSNFCCHHTPFLASTCEYVRQSPPVRSQAHLRGVLAFYHPFLIENTLVLGMIHRYRSDSPPFILVCIPLGGSEEAGGGAQINLPLRWFNRLFLGYLWKKLVVPEVDNLSDSLVYRKGSRLGTTWKFYNLQVGQ
jgi:hypothetical protein